MRRLSLWMRAHPMVGDSAVAVALALFDIFLITVGGEGQGRPLTLTVPVIVATVLPLVIRRRYPIAFAYLVLVIGGVHAAYELGLAAVATSCIALYTLVVYVGRRHAAVYLVVQVVVSTVHISIQFDRDEWLISIGFTAAFLAFSWLLGEFVGARRAYHTEVEARLHLLETERDQSMRIAVSEERSRIARELHDVVAHSVSVIIVHAEGAQYALDSDPETARTALRTISETGRSALSELRRLVDVLRDADAELEPFAPQPDIAALTEVIDRTRAAGLPVSLELDGDLTGLPAGLALGVHRIVQESLTNTLKHGGRGAAAAVRVNGRADAVEIEVSDDGAGRANPVGEPALSQIPGGNGLIGMRERAHVFGGTLSVGPQPGGGWRVLASIPRTDAAAREGSGVETTGDK